MTFRMIKGLAVLAAVGVAWIFGNPSSDARSGDPVVEFAATDQTMNDAQAEARRQLPKFMDTVLDADGLARSDTLVKVAFPTDNPDMEVEVIWVGPFRRVGNGYAGALANEPVAMPGHHAGTEVTFSEDMIRDWILPGPDGRAFGHYTTRVIAAQSNNAEFRQMIGEILMPTPAPDDW